MRYTKLNFTIMAKESVKILKGKLDVDNLLVQLNAALSEEWLAYYQYWIGAFVAEGGMRANVQAEFEEHAQEELGHAKLLADRIIELEGVPVLDPKKWFDLARCKYSIPTDFDVVNLLNQNVASERCAIYATRKSPNLQMVKTSLPVTSPSTSCLWKKNMNKTCRITCETLQE